MSPIWGQQSISQVKTRQKKSQLFADILDQGLVKINLN